MSEVDGKPGECCEMCCACNATVDKLTAARDFAKESARILEESANTYAASARQLEAERDGLRADIERECAISDALRAELGEARRDRDLFRDGSHAAEMKIVELKAELEEANGSLKLWRAANERLRAELEAQQAGHEIAVDGWNDARAQLELREAAEDHANTATVFTDPATLERLRAVLAKVTTP